MFKPGVLMAGAVALVACVSSSAEAPPALPTPFSEIVTTPELVHWAVPRILSFREAQDQEPYIGFGLQVQVLPAALERAKAGEFSLVVTSAEPPDGWFATPLGNDAVVIIVSSENPVGDLTGDEILAIFTGRADNWQSLGGPEQAIQPVVPLEDAETRSYLQRYLLGDRRFASTALVGPSPEAVLKLVREDPGAIGILPLSAVDDEIALVSIDGVDPVEDESYPWLIEILGMAPEEPEGVVREWLAWLQGR